MSLRTTACCLLLGLAFFCSQSPAAWPQDSGQMQELPPGESEVGPKIKEVRAALEKGNAAFQTLSADLTIPILGIAALIDKVDAVQGTYAEGLFAQTLPRSSTSDSDAADPLGFAWQQTDPTDGDLTATSEQSVQNSPFAQAIEKLDQIAAYQEKLKATESTRSNARGENPALHSPSTTKTLGSRLCPSNAEKTGFFGMARTLRTTGSAPTGARQQGRPGRAQNEPPPDPKTLLLAAGLKKAQSELATLSEEARGKIDDIQVLRNEALDRIDAWIELVTISENAEPDDFNLDFLDEGLSLRSEIPATRDDVIAVRNGFARVVAEDSLSNATKRRRVLDAVEQKNVPLSLLFVEDVLTLDEKASAEPLRAIVDDAATEMIAAYDLLAAFVAKFESDDPDNDESDTKPVRPLDTQAQSPAPVTRAKACIPNLNGSWTHMMTPKKDKLPSQRKPCGAMVDLNHSDADIRQLDGIFVQFVPEIGEAARVKNAEKARRLDERIAKHTGGNTPWQTTPCPPPSISMVTGGIEKGKVSLGLNTQHQAKVFAVVTRLQHSLLQELDETGKKVEPIVLFYDISMEKILCNIRIPALAENASDAERAAVVALQELQKNDDRCKEETVPDR